MKMGKVSLEIEEKYIRGGACIDEMGWKIELLYLSELLFNIILFLFGFGN